MKLIRLLLLASTLFSMSTLAPAAVAANKPVVAIIGTGDMGDSLGPKFHQLGYTVI